MKAPRLSVIVPARDAATTLPATLKALERQSLGRQRLELVVVDDGSCDGTAHLAESRVDRLLRTEGQGPAAARNAGIRAAEGEVLLFTDADCEPEPDWAETLIAPILEGRADGTKGTYRTRQRRLVARFVQLEYEDKYRRMAREKTIDFVDTYSAAFRREVFQAVGFYDEGFPGASVEDQELSFRAARGGFRLLFVPDARVWHRHADGPVDYARKKFRIAYWKIRVLRSHPDKILRDSHTPQTLKVQMLVAPWVLLALAAPWSRTAGLVSLAAGVCFLLLAGPMTARILRRDPVVALAAPGLLLIRSLALAGGMVWGLLGRRR